MLKVGIKLEFSERMEENQEPSIDEVLKNIREAILEKERKKYFQQFWPKNSQPAEEVFELSSSMMVNREDIPYSLGFWTFDDVAHKIIKKYQLFFEKRSSGIENQLANSVRVSVKEDE